MSFFELLGIQIFIRLLDAISGFLPENPSVQSAYWAVLLASVAVIVWRKR